MQQQAPDRNGQTWAGAIAEALVRRAATGDVQAIAEVTNRLEGRPAQAIDLNTGGWEGLAERLEKARKRKHESIAAKATL